jgi:hypothetical protein
MLGMSFQFTRTTRCRDQTQTVSVFKRASSLLMSKNDLDGSKIKQGDDKDPYLKHLCPSCGYEYDEAQGFKKRYPPGSFLITSNRTMIL